MIDTIRRHSIRAGSIIASSIRQLVGGASTLLQWGMTSSITPEIGTGTPTLTHGTSYWIKDFERYVEVPIGALGIEGGRGVYNLAASTDIPATQSITVVVGREYQISIGATSASGSTAVLSDAATGTLTGDATNRLGFDTVKTAATTTLTITITGAVTFLQVEDVTGQTNQAPSEYVSVGTLSTPWHGGGIDGYKNFETENGNSVSSGIVTEATGAALTGIKGFVSDPGGTNSALHSNDFSDAVWVKTATPTLAQDQIGIDGVSNTAWSFTDDNAGAQEPIIQTVAIPNDSNTNLASIFVKKDSDETRFFEINLIYDGGTAVRTALDFNTATGATAFRLDDSGSGAATVNSLTVKGVDWWRVTVSAPNNSSGNTSGKIQLYAAIGTIIGTAGSAATGTCIISQCDLELDKTYPGLPIPTTTSAVTSTIAELTHNTWPAGLVNDFVPVITWTPLAAGQGQITILSGYVDASNYIEIGHDGTNIYLRSRIAGTNYNATKALAYVAGTTYSIKARVSATQGKDIFVDDVIGTNHANTTAISEPTVIGIGSMNSLTPILGAAKLVKIYEGDLSDTEVISL